MYIIVSDDYPSFIFWQSLSLTPLFILHSKLTNFSVFEPLDGNTCQSKMGSLVQISCSVVSHPSSPGVTSHLLNSCRSNSFHTCEIVRIRLSHSHSLGRYLFVDPVPHFGLGLDLQKWESFCWIWLSIYF